MDRHLSASKVMGVMIEELETAALGVFVSDTEAERLKCMTECACLRRVIDGAIRHELIPEEKQRRLEARLRETYRVMATRNALEA